MPTYQYACTSCGHQLEAVQSFTDDALTECPDCGGNLRKVFSAVGIVFKGSGFYRTDSRSDKSGAPTATVPPAQKESAGASKESGTSSTTPAPASSTSGSGSGSSGSGSSGSGSSSSGSSSSGSGSSPAKAATSS